MDGVTGPLIGTYGGVGEDVYRKYSIKRRVGFFLMVTSLLSSIGLCFLRVDWDCYSILMLLLDVGSTQKPV